MSAGSEAQGGSRTVVKAITKMAVRPDKTEEFERLTEEEPVIEVYTELAD